MIQNLQIADLPELCDILVNDAWKQMDYPREGVNREYVMGLWTNLIASGASMAFIARQGEIQSFLLGMQSADPYSGQPIAFEQFWYARPGKGKEAIGLFNTFMEDAKRRQCVRVFAGDWQPRGGVDLSKIYQRHGFSQLERYFIKELCQ